MIDRLCWVCIGTRWIRESQGTMCTMSWKIEVIGKCKKKKNKKTSCKWKRNNYGPIVSCPCLPCCKKQKIVNNESEEKKAEEKCLFRCPVPRMGSSTQPGARWRNALLSWRQPNSKQAGVQKPCPLLPTGGKGGGLLHLSSSSSSTPRSLQDLHYH